MIKTRLIKLLSNSKKYIYFQVFWQWMSLLSQVSIVYSLSQILEKALLRSLVTKEIIIYGLVVICAIFLRVYFDRRASYASYQASVDVKRLLRDKIYEKLLKLGASYRDKLPTSEVVQLTAEGVEQLETYFGRYLPQFIYSMLAPLSLFVILSFVSFRASIVLLICVPLIPVSIVFVQKIAKRLLNKYWGIYAELGDSFLENLQGLTTLKIYKADQAKAVEMDKEAQRFRQITMKVLTMQLNSTSIMDIIALGGGAVGMIVALSEFAKSNITLGGGIMIILLASEFFIPLRLLGSFFHIAMNGMAASDKIFELLDLEEEPVKTLALSDEDINISLKNVSFSYDADRQILKNISMNFPTGSFTSIVGPSGCGKSTIAGILMSRNKDYKGNINLQGMELSEISENSLFKKINIISHNSYLFKGTIRDNLLIAKNDASDEEMIEVLKKTNLYDFVITQKGLDTFLEERANNLSGGQRQRLALARALLHDSQVYIFDEATSNIDAESEEMIMEVIHDLSKTKTVILISHRLANVVNSDKIYMMEDGYLVEEGNHKNLMAKEGPYMKHYSYQKELESYSQLTKEGVNG